MSETQNITQMLRLWSDGNREVLEDLMPLVYDELHRQAARFLSRERTDHTLQTTALIHETYLKLVDQREVNWESRTHFFAISANLMRRILVDYARHKHREKRGGDVVKLPLEEAALVVGKEKSIDLMAFATRQRCLVWSLRLVLPASCPARSLVPTQKFAPLRRASITPKMFRLLFSRMYFSSFFSTKSIILICQKKKPDGFPANDALIDRGSKSLSAKKFKN